ncbi:MAG: Rep family protein [Streptococcus orisratti]|uniref:Rep family protein n=1 Tax=Streptococcus orisratti TaxID=114652 RepID=UPI002A91F580|nr:Rep family protein [Streptococcus orisratti]MDY5636068.1 Rep family protein [Streptococcus orisratti]
MINKKTSKLTSLMIAQQFGPDFWKGWDENLIRSKSIQNILEEIVKRANKIATVSEAYGILHDKDTLELYDSETNSFYEKLKQEHAHFLLKFSEGETLVNLAAEIGVESQYIERPKPGRYSYDNMLAYLIHAKDSNKFQYSPTQVVTLLGKNYEEVYKERYSSWEKGKVKKEVKNAIDDIEPLIADIIAGEISKNEILLAPKYLRLYSLYKTKINEAFMTLGELKSLKTKIALENGEFKKTILFINGKSGLGKSRLSKTIAKEIIELAKSHNENWSHVLTAGTNIFDEVNGEEILILDDVRGDSLTASDWLKLLDPYNISPISARYHNRMGSARIIIVTSTKHPLEFFFYCKGNEKEDLSQFIRRFDSLVTLHSDTPTSPTRYFQSSPKPVQNRRIRVPNIEFEAYLSYDFSNNLEISAKDLIEFLLAQVCINNKWDLNKNKPSSEQTLASRSDEDSTEDGIS